jgi:alkylation response protein AidB-like acyl-CoA dehydrogenase
MFATRGDDLRMLGETASRFAQRELRPTVAASDHYPDAPFAEAALARAAELGLLSLVLPKPEGMGSCLALGVALYELAKVNAAFAAILLTQSAGQLLLTELGQQPATDALIAYPLYDELDELGAEVNASPEVDGLRLDGELRFLSLAPLAGQAIVPARLAGELVLALLPADTPGLSRGEPLSTLGLRGCPVADLGLRGCLVEPGAILARGAAARQAVEHVSARLMGPVVALVAGICRGSTLDAVSYTQERVQGGAPIINHQQVRLTLAEMLSETLLAEQAAPALCEASDAGQENSSWTRASFVKARDAAARITMDGVELLGGYGYMQDYGQERRMRDAKQAQLILGRNDLHRLALAVQELGEPASSADQAPG